MYTYNASLSLEQSFLTKYVLQTGDKLLINCGFYNHVAVVLGVDDGRIYITENQKGFGVRHIPLGELLHEYRGRNLSVIRNNLSNIQQQKLINDALRQTGSRYDVLQYNCEHYANSIVRGQAKSEQLQSFFGLAAIATAIFLVSKST